MKISAFLMGTLFLFISLNCIAQNNAEPKLLGVCTVDSLMAKPYSTWFDSAYANYNPTAGPVSSISKNFGTNKTIEIYFGTWCGDSKRELPRMYKILTQAGINMSQVKWIALDNEDSVYKQSPTGDHVDKFIFRVPTFIIYENGKELNRIVEFPINSLEDDVDDICNKRPYRAGYFAYPTIIRWLQQAKLTDARLSTRAFATELKPLVLSAGELSAAGYVLLYQKRVKEAIAIFKINAVLYTETPSCYEALAEAYILDKDSEKATAAVLRAVELKSGKQDMKPMLDLYCKAKFANRN